MVGKLSLQEIATLAIIWEKSGDWEMFSKIWRSWSLTDYPGELTALIVLFPHPAIVPPVPLPQICLPCKLCTRTIFKMHVWDLANKNCWEYWIEGTFCQDDEIEKQTIHVHSNLYYSLSGLPGKMAYWLLNTGWPFNTEGNFYPMTNWLQSVSTCAYPYLCLKKRKKKTT